MACVDATDRCFAVFLLAWAVAVTNSARGMARL
jgi:hypothetical protein